MTKNKRKPRNKYERAIERQLTEAGIKFQYEPERIPFLIAGHYLCDWLLHTPLGPIYVETKGYLRPESKRKLIAVKKQHPELDLRLLFYENRKAQVKWAEKHGFKYAVGMMPEDWLKGL